MVITVNNHFAAICHTYSPHSGTETYNDSDDPNLELISEYHTYYLLKKYSKKSLGPDIVPKLAFQFCNITNYALMSGIFPDAFKISEIVPIPKENPPKALGPSTHL